MEHEIWFTQDLTESKQKSIAEQNGYSTVEEFVADNNLDSIPMLIIL